MQGDEIFMRRHLIDVDDVSPATAPEILPATCELRWLFPEEEGMMQYSRGKYFPQLWNQDINPVGESHNTSLAAPAHTTTNPCTQRKQGVVNPSAVNCKIKLYVIDR